MASGTRLYVTERWLVRTDYCMDTSRATTALYACWWRPDRLARCAAGFSRGSLLRLRMLCNRTAAGVILSHGRCLVDIGFRGVNSHLILELDEETA